MADTIAATNPPAPDTATKHKRTTSTAVAGVYTAAELGGLIAHLSPLPIALGLLSFLISLKHFPSHTVSHAINIYLFSLSTNVN